MCLNKKYIYNVDLVSLHTVFVLDVLQKHGPSGPLLFKNWGSGPPLSPCRCAYEHMHTIMSTINVRK